MSVKKELPLTLSTELLGKGHCYIDAYAGKRRVGSISAREDHRGEFAVRETIVAAKYRRRGVATAMYRAVEEQVGRLLKPATSLSDDAFEFWKSYRPEAVADDLRHRKDELNGRRGCKKGRIGILSDIRGFSARLDFPGGNFICVSADEIDDVILPID